MSLKPKKNLNELENIARKIRMRIIEYSHRTKTPHLASCLSCVDILTAYYFDALNINPEKPFEKSRDRFILSKGHAAPALFQVLAVAGFYPLSRIDDASHNGEDYFGEHPPSPGHLPGVEAATGSLGHGLPIGVGMALAGKMNDENYQVSVLLGDGECNEGSVWEAAMLASKHNLNKLTVIIDFNKWQATDRSHEVTSIDPLVDKWKSFDWQVTEIDGNDMKSLQESIYMDRTNKPLAIIGHTVKGKGISFMEDDNNWHYKTPNEEELQKAREELGF